eukprot:COSAG02_NODE_5678_length_4134_cov_4.936059_2_plen_280_part_00
MRVRRPSGGVFFAAGFFFATSFVVARFFVAGFWTFAATGGVFLFALIRSTSACAWCACVHTGRGGGAVARTSLPASRYRATAYRLRRCAVRVYDILQFTENSNCTVLLRYCTVCTRYSYPWVRGALSTESRISVKRRRSIQDIPGLGPLCMQNCSECRGRGRRRRGRRRRRCHAGAQAVRRSHWTSESVQLLVVWVPKLTAFGFELRALLWDTPRSCSRPSSAPCLHTSETRIAAVHVESHFVLQPVSAHFSNCQPSGAAPLYSVFSGGNPRVASTRPQ